MPDGAATEHELRLGARYGSWGLVDQEHVLAFLEGGGLGGPVERIETHAAIVFLVGDRAFKLKRAVRYSFLDFSTLARRRAALEAELRLNRRTAPGLYKRLVPVTLGPEGELELGGRGDIVEWLLEMVRFPAEARLDVVAARGALDHRLAERLGETVARFHDGLPPERDRGGAEALRSVILGNTNDLRSLVPDVFEEAAVERVIERIENAYAAAVRSLDARRAAGLVRHGHGDLHLANIVLLDGEPVPFDCLEFDRDLAITDVLYDLSFLIMDLSARGAKEAACAALQAWVDARLEDEGLALLPLFAAVRATVRAKVEGFTARATTAGPNADARRAVATRYLEFAGRLLDRTPARLIALGGRSGTGKSSLARALAPDFGAAPGAIILRSDVIRKRLHGRQLDQRLPEEAYAPEVSERVFEALALRARGILRAGYTVICDAVFGLPSQRARLAEVARVENVPFKGVWLEAPQELLELRVQRRLGDVSDADADIVRRQADHVRPPSRAEGWEHVSAAEDFSTVSARVRAVLAGLS